MKFILNEKYLLDEKIFLVEDDVADIKDNAAQIAAKAEVIENDVDQLAATTDAIEATTNTLLICAQNNKTFNKQTADTIANIQKALASQDIWKNKEDILQKIEAYLELMSACFQEVQALQNSATSKRYDAEAKARGLSTTAAALFTDIAANQATITGLKTKMTAALERIKRASRDELITNQIDALQKDYLAYRDAVEKSGIENFITLYEILDTLKQVQTKQRTLKTSVDALDTLAKASASWLGSITPKITALLADLSQSSPKMTAIHRQIDTLRKATATADIKQQLEELSKELDELLATVNEAIAEIQALDTERTNIDSAARGTKTITDWAAEFKKAAEADLNTTEGKGKRVEAV